MRAALLCPDLLFGSQIQGAMEAAGHTVMRLPPEVARLAGEADVLIADLDEPGFDAVGLVTELREAGELGATPTLGFYSHVDQETRRRAEAAGFSRVVPRSRMAREGVSLCEGLAAP